MRLRGLSRTYDRNAFLFFCSFIALFGGTLYLCLFFREREVQNVGESFGLKRSRPGLGNNGPVWKMPQKFLAGFSTNQTMDPSQFQLQIKVLTYNRIVSLERCLLSLEYAEYGQDAVDIEIFVDHTFDDKKGSWSRKSAERVAKSHELLAFLDDFTWSHGQKKVHYRSRNGGIQPQWLESWWPESVNDFAIVVEDDMELSPVYYKYFKHLVAHYYYNVKNFDPQVYGISFQRQSFVPGIGGRPFHLQGEPFLYQLVGTWGQFLFPAPWRQFRLWYDYNRYNASRDPGLQGLKTSVWWKKRGNKIWTPWIIKWAHTRHLYNLYPAFPGNLSLSVSHREVGSNFRVNRKADANLLSWERDSKEIEAQFRKPLPMSRDLRRLDLCNREVPRKVPAVSLEELRAVIRTVEKEKKVAMVIVPVGGYPFVRNWLCHLDGVKGLTNYILLVSEEEQAADLAQRGHAVYIAPLSKKEREAGMAAASQLFWREVWAASHLEAVQAALVLGYDVLVCSADKLWVGDPFTALKAASFDLQGHVNAQSLSDSVLFLRTGTAAMAAWRAVLKAKRRRREGHELVGALFTGNVSFKEMRLASLGLIAVNRSSAGMTDWLPIVLPLPGSLSAVQRAMSLAGSWLVDDYDHACIAVTCSRPWQ